MLRTFEVIFYVCRIDEYVCPPTACHDAADF
jgi:hypothetical protein